MIGASAAMPAGVRGPAATCLTPPLQWLDPLTDPRWPSLVQRHPHASVFHDRGWLEALHRTYGYAPTVLALGTPDELTNALVFCRITSALTGRRLVSLPFSDHCDPLVESQWELQQLIDAAAAVHRSGEARYIEWRPTSGSDGPHASIARATYCLHRLDLRAGEAALFRGFHRNHIVRKIRRSERERLRYEEGSSEPLLDAFFGLIIQTRRRHGLPPQSRRWYRNVLECLPDAARIRVAYAGPRPIAAILTLTGPHAMIFKYGASDARFHPLGGVQMLLWRAMQDAMRLGCRTFDFGRSDADNAGLIAFKEHWGARRSPLAYGFYPPREVRLQKTGRLMARAFTRLAPDWLLIAVGGAVYPHLG